MPNKDQKDTEPALATSFDPPIGRLYRKPGTEEISNLPPLKIFEKLQNGELSPSTTNVISVLAAPYLLPWATNKVADTVIKMVNQNAESFVTRVKANPYGARKYLSGAADRDRDMAGERGSNIHLACELLGKNQSIQHLNLTDEEKAAVDQWKKWLDAFQPTFTHLESTGYGTTRNNLSYAGTVDFTAIIEGETCMGDYKCVTDETPILLPDGSHKKASEIQKGDEVVAWDKRSGLHTAKVLYRFWN